MIQSWLAVGSPQNWQIAFEHGNMWGLEATPRFTTLWQRVNRGDRLFFYATQPVGGLIGYGTIRAQLKQDRPLWPEEVAQNKVVWPLRLEFDVEYLFPQDTWQSKRFVSVFLRGRAPLGFQMIPEEAANEIVSALEAERPPEEELPPSHAAVIEKLKEIGKLQGYIADKEYHMDGGRLDVVWRKVERAVPMYVFEVQVGGDIYHALAKLKHAHDIWNSRIFLVADEEDRAKARELLTGTFHEIEGDLQFIDLEVVDDLLGRKRSVRDLESELGLR